MIFYLFIFKNRKKDHISYATNSQLLIFEKNWLVWPADIWPAHFFQILKVRKIKLFYCVADVANYLKEFFIVWALVTSSFCS